MTNKKSYDYLFKLILIGDSDVGKTTILSKFGETTTNQIFASTIGFDFIIRTIEVEGKKIKLQIWDTAGQERFKTITRAFYRGSLGIMAVYDIGNEKSFNNIKHWIENIQMNANSDVEIMLIGNKCDLNMERQVSRERGEQLALEYKINFFETSAQEADNVEAAFYMIACNVKNKIEMEANKQNDETTDVVTLQPQPAPKKRISLCSLL